MKQAKAEAIPLIFAGSAMKKKKGGRYMIAYTEKFKILRKLLPPSPPLTSLTAVSTPATRVRGLVRVGSLR